MSGGGVLPNGSVTQSDREYVDTWRSFSGPILDIIAPLGFRRYGFDPGVLFSRVSGEMLDLPTDVIAAINAKIAALQARLATRDARIAQLEGMLASPAQAAPQGDAAGDLSQDADWLLRQMETQDLATLRDIAKSYPCKRNGWPDEGRPA